MKECSLVVIFEVCALYTSVLLGQIEDVCAWCLHSAHVGYTHSQTQRHTHALAVTGLVVVLSLKMLFCCYHHRGKNTSEPKECLSVSNSCQSQGKCRWTATAGEERLNFQVQTKNVTHCEKYMLCASVRLQSMEGLAFNTHWLGMQTWTRCLVIALHSLQPTHDIAW